MNTPKVSPRSIGRFFSIALPCAVAIVLAVGMAGCPMNEPQGTPVVDLAVGSPNGFIFCRSVEDPSPYDYAKILIYLDVLNGNDQQDPEIVISGQDVPQVAFPQSIVLTESDLYVADPLSDRVMIWRNYRGLAAKGDGFPEPDVELTTGIDYPQQIIVEDNRLLVLSTGGNNGVAIFQDAANLSADVAPDLLVPFDQPLAMEYEDDHLYIAGFDGDKGISYQVVHAYNSVTDLLVAKGGAGPDAILSGASWLNLDQNGPIIPQGLKVAGNELYVATAVNFVFVFSPADDLADEQAPDAVLSESNGALQSPKSMECVGDRLYVGNSGQIPIDKSEKTNSIGLVGYDDASNLTTGQSPSLVFDSSSAQIAAVMGLVSEDNFLFVAASNATGFFLNKCKDASKYFPYGSYYEVGDVHIYRGADTMQVGLQADIVLPALKDFTVPIAIDTNRRFTGIP